MVRDISWEDEAQRNADTGIIIREADRLTALVNEILEYTSLQNGRDKREFTEVDFSALVKKVVRQFEPLLNQNDGMIESDIEDGEIHGAEYGVSSEKGKGSRFWISMKKQ